MAERKTIPTNKDVYEFIREFTNNEQKYNDSLELVKLMKEVTGCKPKMWGPSIVGFGKHLYKTTNSKQEGEMFLVGFSPRKAAISLYVYTGKSEHEHLLANLGKFKKGKACIYINKLSDINLQQLKQLMNETVKYKKSQNEENKN